MSTLVRAKYDNGILKLKEPLPLLDEEQVSVLVTPVKQWEKAFRALLAKVHARTRRFSAREIEQDITRAKRFWLAQRLTRRSRLTMTDVADIDAKVKSTLAKRYRMS